MCMCLSNTDVFVQWLRMWTASTNVPGLVLLTGDSLIGSPAGFFIRCNSMRPSLNKANAPGRFLRHFLAALAVKH